MKFTVVKWLTLSLRLFVQSCDVFLLRIGKQCIMLNKRFRSKFSLKKPFRNLKIKSYYSMRKQKNFMKNILASEKKNIRTEKFLRFLVFLDSNSEVYFILFWYHKFCLPKITQTFKYTWILDSISTYLAE